jgi:hypothetical protein
MMQTDQNRSSVPASFHLTPASSRAAYESLLNRIRHGVTFSQSPLGAPSANQELVRDLTAGQRLFRRPENSERALGQLAESDRVLVDPFADGRQVIAGPVRMVILDERLGALNERSDLDETIAHGRELRGDLLSLYGGLTEVFTLCEKIADFSLDGCESVGS